MVDTLEFLKTNFQHQSYYAKFAARLLKLDGNFMYVDSQDVIDRFRRICKPPDTEFEFNNDEFLLLCFWLYKHGYVIKEFPNVLSRPTSLHGFANQEIRKYIQSKKGHNGDVLWSDRRDLCDNLAITTNSSFQLIPSEVESKIRLISTRSAEFDSMTKDEQLQNLNNLIENLLKPSQKGKFLTLDYSKVFFGFLSEEDVKQYRQRTHPFRHATQDTLEQRSKMSEGEKLLLSQLGVFIARHLYDYLNKTPRP